MFGGGGGGGVLETDHVISEPMRGLQKTHGEWTSDRQTNRQTDMLTVTVKRLCFLAISTFVKAYSQDHLITASVLSTNGKYT